MGRGEMYKTTIQQRLFDTDMKPTVPTESKNEVKNTVIQENTISTQLPKESEIQINGSTIERIIIFYRDKSFKEYFPEK